MYITDVRPRSDITPRMYAVDYELPSGSLAFTTIVLALCPRHALEQVSEMFPELRKMYSRGRVYDVAYVQVDWEVGQTFVIKRSRTRQPMLLLDIDIQKGPRAGSRNGRRSR